MNAPTVRPDVLPPQSITLDDEEQRAGQLSTEHRELAALILSCRGYVVLKNALPLSYVDSLRADMEDIYADCTTTLGAEETGTSPEAIQKVRYSARRGAAFWYRKARWRIFPRLTGPMADPKLVANPFAMPVLESLLGKGFFCKYVSSDTCVKGSILQSPHSDIDTNDVIVDNRWSPRGYIVNVPIMECGLHNGPMEVWPGGSHMWTFDLMKRFGLAPDVQDGRNPPVEKVAEYFPSIKLSIGPGEVLIRDLTMWHRGTPNPTDVPRTMLTIAYFKQGYAYGYGDLAYNIDRPLYDAMPEASRWPFAHHFALPTRLKRRGKQLRSAAKKAAVNFVKSRLSK